MMASYCGRASTVQRAPFVERTASLIRVTIDASSASSGWIVAKASMSVFEEQLQGLRKNIGVAGLRILQSRRNPTSGEMPDNKIESHTGCVCSLSLGPLHPSGRVVAIDCGLAHWMSS